MRRTGRLGKTLASILQTRVLRILILGLLIMLPLIFLASVPGPESRISDIVGERGYSLAGWELGNFLDKWTHKLTSIFGGGSSSDQEARAKVEEYFRLNREIAELDGAVGRSLPLGQGSLSSLQGQRQRLDSQRRGLRGEVEEIIEGQISKVLSNEGLSWKLPFLDSDGYLFPPVDFRFDDPPQVLAVSPRSRIELISTRLLDPGLGLDSVVEMESAIEGDGVTSALVTGAGGVATYPSIVSQSSSLRQVLRTAAHEWVHHYLIFHPMGQHYWAGEEMTAVNETVADVVGDELGEKAYRTYYATSSEEQAPAPSTPEGSEEDFDFNRVMRETRLRADQLLAQGLVEEAERYLEEQRLYLAENGVYLRRLNQAYFAYYGTYADKPTSVSLIGSQVRELRQKGASLKEFIETVASISSYQELLQMLEGP